MFSLPKQESKNHSGTANNRPGKVEGGCKSPSETNGRSKKRRGDLVVPPYVREEWDKGSSHRDDMADLLLQHNGDKAAQ